ncbi:MAG: DUF554 domain-containing protein [Dysgonamonadaceae bacterium]|jgi:uncharacterized membrane protein YqgA involved in biofilm formation|nr:DUF554 domain-containing protein [Dysgonamonadaceae bacterium]
MSGTIINAGAIIVGGSLGLLLKKGLPEKYNMIYFQAVGLFTFILGVGMALKMAFPLLVVFSLITGGITGEFFKLETRMNQAGNYVKRKLKFGNDRFTEGMVTSFLLFCMGSMSILGAVEEGLTGNISELLKAKSLMDGFSSLLLASALGVGVLFSVIPLLLYQGGLTLLAQYLGKDIPEHYINEITVIGGIILIGLAFDILGIKKFRILNMLPALIYICLFIWIGEMI